MILILIRKSLNSMRRHLVKMTERLPLYHDDDLISNHSATSPPLHGKDTTMDTMVGGLHDSEVAVWALKNSQQIFAALDFASSLHIKHSFIRYKSTLKDILVHILLAKLQSDKTFK